MATNEETLDHLVILRGAVNNAMNNISRYRGFNTEMTSAAKKALLATVTTVPAALQHADDCAICSTWDGSVAP